MPVYSRIKEIVFTLFMLGDKTRARISVDYHFAPFQYCVVPKTCHANLYC